jgi:tRNA-binding protein
MTNNISFKDFQKLDIRIGTVIDAEVPKWSHWVTKLTVDFGDPPAGGGKKNAFAGIMKFYKVKDLVGKQFAFVVNLEPKKIGPEGDISEVMVLAASVPDKTGKTEDERPVLLNISEKVPNGTKVR